MSAKKKAAQPWFPVEYDDDITNAIKALEAGVASQGQQQRALRWIVESAAGTYDMSFRPGGAEGERATAFAEGRRFVGNSIIKQLRLRQKAS